MAVYTRIGAEDMAAIVEAFDVGTLLSAKGIAEGVSNSNWLLEAQRKGEEPHRFILTMYEERTDTQDLPFFLDLLDYLALHDCPVPRTIHDRDGSSHRFHQGKALALIEFLPGVSVSEPTPGQARSVGAALAKVHVAATGFVQQRANSMGLATWSRLLGDCGEQGLASIHPELAPIVERELSYLTSGWPTGLPEGIVHADLFPDNVLMLGDEVTGLIDFYFACTDILAYDVAVTHAAWCFSDDGRRFDPEISRALLAGYESIRPLSAQERAALPLLARAAAIRFLSTRAYDWMNTPADALVTPKDPVPFLRRLEFYASPDNAGLFDLPA